MATSMATGMATGMAMNMEPTPAHTFGAACRLAPVEEPDPADALLDGIPPINAQFFYHSLIPIDDPLSTATAAVPASSENKSSKALRPFSHPDNNALERAWLSLASSRHRTSHQASLANRSPSASLVAENDDTLHGIVDALVRKHKEKHAHDPQPKPPLEQPMDSLAATATPVCCQELLIEASNTLRETFCEATRRRQPHLDQEHVIEKVMAAMENDRPAPIAVPPRMAPFASSSSPRTEVFVLPGLSTSSRGRASSLISNPPASRSASTDSRPHHPSMSSTPRPDVSLPRPAPGSIRPPVLDDGISGKPFVKVGDDEAKAPLGQTPQSVESAGRGGVVEKETTSPAQQRPTRPGPEAKEGVAKEARVADVPVGVSKLHVVSLPALQMKPIYWSPVNDISIVSRATWFYRDTMLPLEPTVANQLEAGYRELRPYCQTWKDEIRCAIEVGPEGEEKVSHPLWPKAVAPEAGKGDEQDIAEPTISSDPFCAAHCFRGEAAAEGTVEPVVAAATQVTDNSRSYARFHVIYKDAGTAFLLKPSLRPSAYYGRRPVSKIVKGLTIGIPVVRGFNRYTWDEMHEKKKNMTPKFKESGEMTSGPDRHRDSTYGNCPGCEVEIDRGRVTDLVLVAHGIGQKFAERVESYHFTHAVTAFRRSVNIELGGGTVKTVLRDGFNGIMVLPVNWRHALSLEDGGPMSDEDRANAGSEGFGLKDIEPGTIPAVRSLISDVMFDIPFYMSQHKPKMIQALVAEANRVYRLWCSNNPEFAKKGRVHLIAHSLGSVMALEILSKQPDVLPPLDLSKLATETSFLEFDTTNLFLLGSPAGFFLLLERGGLVPRRGRQKPGAEPNDIHAKDVVGDTGVFGCLAVDNIYNILAKEDPIAYLLNGTIDPLYASSLRLAHVPSTTTSWFKSMGDAVRGFIPVGSAPTSSDLNAPVPTKPPTFRLPSQLELEVHDFTREEIAERKAFLLNDNGQVDFYLRSGTGPLEIQYLNMLSAHTSYWMNKDLVRLLCVEIGREPGRANTLPVMRAIKMTRRDRAGK